MKAIKLSDILRIKKKGIVIHNDVKGITASQLEQSLNILKSK